MKRPPREQGPFVNKLHIHTKMLPSGYNSNCHSNSASEVTLYSTNRETSRRNASALHRSIAGTKASAALKTDANPKHKYVTENGKPADKKEDSESDEEERKGE